MILKLFVSYNTPIDTRASIKQKKTCRPSEPIGYLKKYVFFLQRSYKGSEIVAKRPQFPIPFKDLGLIIECAILTIINGDDIGYRDYGSKISNN